MICCRLNTPQTRSGLFRWKTLDHRDFVSLRIMADFIHEAANQQQSTSSHAIHIDLFVGSRTSDGL